MDVEQSIFSRPSGLEAAPRSPIRTTYSLQLDYALGSCKIGRLSTESPIQTSRLIRGAVGCHDVDHRDVVISDERRRPVIIIFLSASQSMKCRYCTCSCRHPSRTDRRFIIADVSLRLRPSRPVIVNHTESIMRLRGHLRPVARSIWTSYS
jgi:hypothetical protein